MTALSRISYRTIAPSLNPKQAASLPCDGYAMPSVGMAVAYFKQREMTLHR